MTRNADIYRELHATSPAGLVVFALACAERGSGIFQALAEHVEGEQLSGILELAWSAAAGDADDGDSAATVEEFEELAESFDPDESDTSFFVVQSALLAVNAIALLSDPRPARAELSGQTLETLLGDFDFRLSGQTAVIVRAGETPPPPGRLQRLEQEAQTATMRALTALPNGDVASREFLDEIRESCRAARDEIASATEAVAELAGWL
ncbi:hypothetical protein [Nocardia sp. NPDC057668]|uniref:hypothetical protein n=1 Tax=Nocardia sp. NPDC057668 TaxID=3346202 RepID=UPI003670A373